MRSFLSALCNIVVIAILVLGLISINNWVAANNQYDADRSNPFSSLSSNTKPPQLWPEMKKVLRRTRELLIERL